MAITQPKSMLPGVQTPSTHAEPTDMHTPSTHAEPTDMHTPSTHADPTDGVQTPSTHADPPLSPLSEYTGDSESAKNAACVHINKQKKIQPL